MSRYLVTGGAGFIGSNLTKRLLEQGHFVRVLDNLSTGKRERIPEGVDFIEKDFTDLESIKPHFTDIDGVFHVGALPRVPLSIEKPVETTINNVMGTLNVLVAARDGGVKRVVYSASSSAYGATDALPNHPDAHPKPLNPYGLQKLIGEQFCEQFSRFYNLGTVCLRYFNVYGPGMADEGAYVTVMSIFKRQKLAGEPLTIAGDGEQTRDFTHVYDVVDANIRAMTSPNVGKGERLNVGAGSQHSINKIAAMFGGEVKYIPERVGEARHTRADISRTKEMIGWEPTVQFEDGLRSLLKEWGIGERS